MAATASMSAPSTATATSASYAGGPTATRTKTIRVPPRISLADLTHNNVGTLRKLHSVLFPIAYSDKYYKEVLSPELSDYCQLIYYNDIPVGAITCRIERDPAATESEDPSSSAAQSTGKLYLMTLGVLAPYRRQGLATKLVSHVFEKATEASLAASLTPPQPQPVKEQPTKSEAKPVEKKNKGKGKAGAAASTTSAPAAEPAKVEAPPPAPPAPILKCIFVHVQTSNNDAKAFWELQGFKEKEVIKDYYKPTIEGPRDTWLLEKEIDV